MLEETVSV